MRNTALTILGLVLVTQMTAMASEPPAFFTYQGRILKANGVDPVENASVSFKIQVRSPDGLCLMFEESHIRDMTGTSGVFSLVIGQGTNSGASPLTLNQVFDNSMPRTGASGCVFTPVARDSRRLRLTYDTGTEVVSLPMDQWIMSVPYAMNSQTLQGLDKSAFLQTSLYSNQARIDSVLPYAAQLVALATGTSNQFVKASELTSGTLDLSGGTGAKVPAPAGAEYAVNKSYADSKLGGRELNVAGLVNGQVLVYNGTTTKWESQTLPSAPVSSVNGRTGAVTVTASEFVGTAAGTLAAGNDSRIVNAVQSGGTLSGGDLTGTYASPRVSKLQNVEISATAPTNGQVMLYNATTSKWEPQGLPSAPVSSVAGRTGAVVLSAADISGTSSVAQGGTGQTSYTAGQILVGNSSGGLTKTTITAGTGVSVINSDGAITINAAGSGGTVTNVTASSPLSVINGSSAPALSLASGTATGQTMRWNGTAWSIAFPNLSDLRGAAFAQQLPTTCSAAQVWAYQTPSDTYACLNIVVTTSQVSGLGTAATLSVGTGAGTVAAGNDSRIVNAVQTSDLATLKVVQLDSGNKLPALDGSQLTNLPQPAMAPFSNMDVIESLSQTTWTVPAGVTRVFVQVWGGGGGGAGGTGTLLAAIGGGGGGGAGFGANYVNVTPGASVAVTVGAGGSAGSQTNAGTAGGSTNFGAISASGGAGGGAGAGSAAQTPAAGGTSSALLKITGGTGTAAGILSLGGMGGSAGGAGGAGGGGSSSNVSAAAPGSAPGGGGGGGGAAILLNGGAGGGAGGQGRIIVWY